MTDDASTAYICIYCPFNSDNLQALEHHLTSAHGHACQDTPQSSSSNIISKAKKRDAPDDEQSQSSLDGTEQLSEHSVGVKRIKRTSSPTSAHLFLNSSEDYSESEDDERDSSSNLPILSCPVCGSTYHHPSQLARHVKRKHHVDLSNPSGSAIEDINKNEFTDQQTDILPFSSSLSGCCETATATTDCPYCDFKTTDIELFKGHIIAHIRDKNYRCLLCNRLYKYRGDCSFHIRRKHHRYSVNSNDYIQRFLFDTVDGDEALSSQAGGHSLSGNVSTNHSNSTRELDEPLRYFGCPYCDYTSNYGGDVRKHQARKHPNAESKVMKIIRQDSERQNFDEDDEDDTHHLPSTPPTNSGTKPDKLPAPPPPPAPPPILPNFAPVRVFQCSSCHQQGTYKWVVERHIRAKHTDQADVHVIELPAELSVKMQKITPPLKRFRCSLCPLQSKHNWVVIRHIKHFHTLQTASVVDIQPNGKPINEDALPFQNGDFANKSDNHDSETSSISSSCMENGIEHEDEPMSKPDSMTLLYKCSLCHYQSSISWNIQKHINENHANQPNAYILTQCRQTKISSNDLGKKKSKHKNGFHRSLSPTSALAKAKFSPAVEEALLSIQGSKLNPILYAVQPKFGIKRLKCRHCFYRSNWKTDMIRHVRIRHNLTEPDHNKDMIIMTEQEARTTIELYENTFGKELRRRTFRTWDDWTKAEQEFTPKDGSLQYANPNNGQTSTDPVPKKTSSSTRLKTFDHDQTKRVNKTNINLEFPPNNKSTLFNQPSAVTNDDYKQLPNPSNIVSRLLLTTSPSPNTDDDAPLDLSLKPSVSSSSEETFHSLLTYRCSACPFKHSDWSTIQHHITLHLTGQGLLCSLCSYVTESQKSIIRHMTIDHPTSQITTNFPSPSPILTAHVLEQHQCSLCSFHCDRSEALNLHRRLEHDEEEFDIDSSDDEDDIIASTTKHLFDCPLCSPSSNTNIYSNLEQFTMHVITHQNNNQSCPFCSFVVHPTSSHTLDQHIRLHFNGTLVQPDPIVGVEQVKEFLMLE